MSASGAATETPDTSIRALLFDEDEVQEAEDWRAALGRSSGSSILWIDVEHPDESVVDDLADALELESETVTRLAEPPGRPYFGDFGRYLHVTAYAPAGGTPMSHELERIGCVVSESWVVTVHEAEIPVLQTFRERAEGYGETGRLNGLEFVAALTEWVLEEYLDAFERIEHELEELDARAMVDRLEEPDAALQQLVDLRREIGRLRRVLVSHRLVFLSLTRPELGGMSSVDTAERFAELRGRLEDVVQAARDSRDAVVGSFDVLIARTGHRTNEIMKVLTLASVLLLPGSLLAGLLGMNFRLGFFEHAWLFWVVIAIIGGLALSTVAVARNRRWI